MLKKFLTTLTICALAPDAMAECSSSAPFKYGVNSPAEVYAKSGKRSLGENGVLIFDYGTAYDRLGKWHNPFFIARYAHALYRDWYSGGCSDERVKLSFLLQSTYLVNNYEEKDGMAYWTYPFANSYFDVEPGWISGIGQSQIAGVLYRAYELTGEEKFRDVSAKAVETYLRPMDKGGVVTQSEKGLWVQEVPDPSGREFNILNGHITGVLGLQDVAILTGDERLFNLVGKGIDAVRQHIRDFDAGFTSFYALDGKVGEEAKLAPRGGYNNLHIWQLKKLYEIDGDPVFQDMAVRLQSYEEINDRRSAKGSTNAKTHGPEEAAGWYGTRFWSHNEFPTWYAVDLNDDAVISGIYIGSYIGKAAPRDFSVSILINGSWVEIWSVVGNSEKSLYLEFENPISTAGIRLDIESDNGNGNVALSAFMPIRSNITFVKTPERVKLNPAPFFPGYLTRQNGNDIGVAR